jgi:hypothetical protein
MRFMIAVLALLCAPASAHEVHHKGHILDYSKWKNKLDKGCCSSNDCGQAKDEDVKYSPIVQVRVEGQWCEVKPHHYLKDGANAPDWSTAHMCVRPQSIPSRTC